MKVSISDKCTGCGACSAINPEIFEIYDNYATVNSDFIEGKEDDCIDAALACPVNAIHIKEY
ncbi:ferredoxin [bacterium]|nr:ferredoxin [bacterium]